MHTEDLISWKIYVCVCVFSYYVKWFPYCDYRLNV